MPVHSVHLNVRFERLDVKIDVMAVHFNMTFNVAWPVKLTQRFEACVLIAGLFDSICPVQLHRDVSLPDALLLIDFTHDLSAFERVLNAVTFNARLLCFHTSIRKHSAHGDAVRVKRRLRFLFHDASIR